MIGDFDKSYVDRRKKYKRDIIEDLLKIQENYAKEMFPEKKGGKLYEIFATKKCE